MKIRSIKRPCFHSYRSANDWCCSILFHRLLHISILQNKHLFSVCFITIETFGPLLPYLGSWHEATSVHTQLYSLISSASWVITGKVLRYSDASRGKQQSWWKGWRNVLWGAVQDSGFVQFGEKEDEEWPHCSLQLPEEGSGEGGADLRWQDVGMVPSCVRAASDLTLSSISLLREWSDTGTGFSECCSNLHPCQCLDNTLNEL